MAILVDHNFEGDFPTVAQLAIAYPGALEVFTKYNIDYCCGGHRSLEDACQRVGLDPKKVRAEIWQSFDGSSQPLRAENWTSSFLIDFIVQNHHSFVKKSIPELDGLLAKVCDRHGDDSPELLQLRACFHDLADELLSHMQKEELVLFPAMKRLDANYATDHPLEKTLQAPISAMEHEHADAGELITRMRTLSNTYTPPAFACPTYRATYQRLKEFDGDLMKHIHLENNILFPRFRTQAARCVL